MSTTTIHCDQCNVLAINGTACHEHGCPDSHIDPCTGEPYQVECDWCGSACDEQPRNPNSAVRSFCDDSCAEDYFG